MNKKLAIVLALLTSASILVWVLLSKSEKEPRQPIQMIEAASWEEKSLDTLLYESDAIVVGYFETAHPSRWNTPDGDLPDNATFETVRDNDLYIYTEYIFRVEEFLKGNQPETSITIRTFGGQVGKDSMTMGSDISYELGQPYLLFLSYDPRLAQAGDPGPFLVYHPATYSLSNDKATSWSGERNTEELKNYIRNSPLAGITANIPDTTEASEIMQRIRTAYDIEVEAKQSSDFSKLPDVFINDHRYQLNPDTLEFVRTVTNNPSLELAGYLDYKLAYSKRGGDPTRINIPLESYWIKFISITINDDSATVIYDLGSRRRMLTLVLTNENWYIAGTRGITTYEDNSPSSALAPNIQNTEEVQEIIRTVEAAYDIEAEAAYDFNTEKFQLVFINDQRYKTETNKLDFVRNFLDNPSMESAGYLDYKIAYYNWWHESALLFETAKEKAASENRELTQEELESIIDSEWAKKWGTAPARGKRPVREITLQFISIEVDGEIATAYIHDSLKAVILYLVRLDEKWYIAGAQEI